MKKVIFLILTPLVILVSCQKELTFEASPDSPPAPVPEKTLLYQFVIIDTTTVNRDTSQKYVFQYDDRGRNTRIGYDDYDSNGQISEYRYTHGFSYNGTDTMPSMVTTNSLIQDPRHPSYQSDTNYYQYEKGMLVYDSGIHRGYQRTAAVTVYKYNYLPGVAEQYIKISVPGFSYWEMSRRLFFEVQNGNITKQQTDTSALRYKTLYTCNFSYSNHPNPLFKTRLGYVEQPYPFYSESDMYCHTNFSPNTVTTAYATSDNNYVQYDVKFSYTYNANGYPVTVKTEDRKYNHFNKNAGIFVYK